MKSIFYNLCFGSWKGAAEDGVQEAWALYAQPKDGKRYQDFHGLPSSWQSNIYLLDPGNEAWQRYLCDRNDEVYRLFDSMAIRSTSWATAAHAMMRRGARSISHAPMPPSSRPSRSVVPRSVSS